MECDRARFAEDTEGFEGGIRPPLESMSRLKVASGLGRDFPSSESDRKSARSSGAGQKNGVVVPSVKNIVEAW